MYYPEEVVEEVIAANDIVDVIGDYVSLKKSGSSYQGLCPFHSEKTPSFSVSPSKQVFHCFGCGEGGNVITFLMKHENYNFQEALQSLADRAKIKLPEANYSEQAKARARERDVLLSINKDAATYYFKMLRSSKGARGMEYFTGRQLSPETLQKFGLGFADGAQSDLIAHLRKKGYRDEDILTAGVAAFDEKRGLHDKFWNRVMFPIMDATNRVIGFGGRVMGDGKPKYLNSPETPVFDKSRNLYGLNLAKRSKAGYFILCEGYMDVIAMHQAGFDQAVASLGTSFTEGQALILKRYVKQVLLSYDSDGAGVKAAMRNIEILRRAGLTGKVVDLRPYKDPDEFMKALGREKFQERLDHAENAFFYQIRQIEGNYQMDDPASRTEFYHEIAKRLCAFEDEIERENYIRAMAEKYYIPVESLRREVAAYGQIYQKDMPLQGDAMRRRDKASRGGSDARQSAQVAAGRQTGAPAGAGNASGGESAADPGRDRIVAGGAQKRADGGYGGPERQPFKSGTEGKRISNMQRALRRNERLLLTWVSDEPELYVKIRDYIKADDFEEGLYRKAAKKYFDMLEEHFGDALHVTASGGNQTGRISPASVVAIFDTEEEMQEAAGLFEERIIGLTSDKEREQALRDVLLSVKRASFEQLQKQTGDPDILKKIVSGKKELEAIGRLKL